MNLLSEKLRTFWESGAADKSAFANSVLKMDFFDAEGKKVNVELTVDAENLDKILKDRIAKGIDTFFTCLRLCLQSNAEKLAEIKKINILLAGNSSRSSIFQALMKKRISPDTEAEKSAAASSSSAEGEPEKAAEQAADNPEYVLYPPLGTEEANQIIAERQLPENDALLVKPNGKTGVAMGLLMSRSGVKVINPEVGFRFFIGYKQKNRFCCIPEDGKAVYNTWYELMDAEEREVDLYYSPLSIATGEDFSIARCSKKILKLKKACEDCLVFVRAVTPDTIEYCVAEDEDFAAAEEYTLDPVRVQLG